MRKLGLFAIIVVFAVPARGETGGSPTSERFRTLFGEWQSTDASPPSIAAAAPAVVVSKAGDALGRPIDFSRVVSARLVTGHVAPGLAGLSGALPSIRPLASSIMTSGFGMRRHPILGGSRAHMGVDLAAPVGTPIVATSDGVVSQADWRGGYGLFVAVEHGGGLQTRYGHMSRLNVAGGQRVRKGEVIGYVGSTGRSTGPHLHYEVRMSGQAMNPATLGGRR